MGENVRYGIHDTQYILEGSYSRRGLYKFTAADISTYKKTFLSTLIPLYYQDISMDFLKEKAADLNSRLQKMLLRHYKLLMFDTRFILSIKKGVHLCFA
jgi:hypothetical protein